MSPIYPTPDQPCPHGCVNGVCTADEGTSCYCPIHGPTPDQPEQERMHEFDPACNCGPCLEERGLASADPSLHQRIEGLIAELEEVARDPTTLKLIVRLRAVLKGEA